MKHIGTQASRTATISEDGGITIVNLALINDEDAQRWYEVKDGELIDTEVSAPYVDDAIQAARIAWRGWDFTITGRHVQVLPVE